MTGTTCLARVCQSSHCCCLTPRGTDESKVHGEVTLETLSSYHADSVETTIKRLACATILCFISTKMESSVQAMWVIKPCEMLSIARQLTLVLGCNGVPAQRKPILIIDCIGIKMVYRRPL